MIKTFLRGIEILSSYIDCEKRDNLFLQAEHDVIYTSFRFNFAEMDEDDIEEIKKLTGWYFDEDVECWAYFT